MQTKEFFELLDANAEKELVFEYRPEEFVPKAYHITEVKNVHIHSVDCGGRPDEYFETIVQLWVSGTENKEQYMLAGKALSIFQKVDSVKPIRRDTPLLIEWGNAQWPTSNYSIRNVVVDDDSVRLQMFVQPTVCKPKLELSVLGKSSGCC